MGLDPVTFMGSSIVILVCVVEVLCFREERNDMKSISIKVYRLLGLENVCVGNDWIYNRNYVVSGVKKELHKFYLNFCF